MNSCYLLGMYEKAVPAELGWDERLRTAASCGFDYIELSIDESDGRLARLDVDGDEPATIAAAVRRSGVPIGSLCLSAHRRFPLGSHDAATRTRALEIMRAALDLACLLGARTIQLAGYDVYYEASDARTRELFADNLELAAQMAARAGVALGFETMETPFMDTVGKAMAQVRRIGSPYLGVYPDIGNLTNASLLYGTDVADDIALGAGSILAAHCKETVAGAYREIPFGTGTTDYTGALRELANQGVRRFVAEFWCSGSPSWRSEARDAARYVRARIDDAFSGRARTAGPASSPTRL